jgi:hypothetical protein
MEVIRHEAPGQDVVGRFLERGLQTVYEFLGIGLMMEDGAAFNSASDNVMEKSGGVQSRESGHGQSLENKDATGNKSIKQQRPLSLTDRDASYGPGL